MTDALRELEDELTRALGVLEAKASEVVWEAMTGLAHVDPDITFRLVAATAGINPDSDAAFRQIAAAAGIEPDDEVDEVFGEAEKALADAVRDANWTVARARRRLRETITAAPRQ